MSRLNQRAYRDRKICILHKNEVCFPGRMDEETDPRLRQWSNRCRNDADRRNFEDSDDLQAAEAALRGDTRRNSALLADDGHTMAREDHRSEAAAHPCGSDAPGRQLRQGVSAFNQCEFEPQAYSPGCPNGIAPSRALLRRIVITRAKSFIPMRT
jgi:hypothetical protein